MIATSTPQYENKLCIMRGPAIADDEAALNALGLDGWELVAVTSPSAVWNPNAGHDERGHHVGGFETLVAVAYLRRPLQNT